MTCLVLVASLVIIVDRLAKFLVFNNLFEGQSVPVMAKIFHLTLVLNTGAAFGLFALGRGMGWIAQALEQRATGELIRPRAAYTGPRPSPD